MAYKFKNGIDVSSAGFYVGTTKGSSSQVITGDGKLVAKSSFIGPTGPTGPAGPTGADGSAVPIANNYIGDKIPEFYWGIEVYNSGPDYRNYFGVCTTADMLDIYFPDDAVSGKDLGGSEPFENNEQYLLITNANIDNNQIKIHLESVYQLIIPDGIVDFELDLYDSLEIRAKRINIESTPDETYKRALGNGDPNNYAYDYAFVVTCNKLRNAY